MKNRWKFLVICGCLSIGVATIIGFTIMSSARDIAVVIDEYWDTERGEKCKIVCIVDSCDFNLSGITEEEVRDVVMWRCKKIFGLFADGLADMFNMQNMESREPAEVINVLKDEKKMTIFRKGVTIEIRGISGEQEQIINRFDFKIKDDNEKEVSGPKFLFDPK